jgi:arabinosaccharide transport system substrate-binding protein
MQFPFGRPILALLFCAVLSGGALFFRTPARRADLTLWVSAESHARMYRGDGRSVSLLDEFHNRTGKSVRLDLIAPGPMDVRLASLFMFSDGNKATTDHSAPDLVELDLGSIGKFFRPPIEEIGFLPLNDYLQCSGWMNRIVRSRFAPWSKDGTIFGVPDDLHPCTITYRKDLFDQAGVDLQSAQTWPEFQRRALEFENYWQRRGQPRAAMGLSSVTPDLLLVMLRQQHVQLVDAELGVHLADEKVVQTLCWYAQAVTGPARMAADLNPTAGQNARDLASGDICSLITPDWMVGDLKQYGPEMAGKLRMMPLPRFAEDDARTASWGGTMIGITRTCQDPDSAWKLIEALYLDPGALKARQASTGILPPIPEYWTQAVYHQPDPFFANQKVDELYIELARELPEMPMTPYTTAAQTFLSIAMNQAVGRARSSGASGLEPACRESLHAAAGRLSAMIEFDGGVRRSHFSLLGELQQRRPE